eukprot:TRINITY_DN1284_c0_g1_i3.p1 TRINITY_DN1284_c0_g1~~TRINITY_DN1284_c0_g1_i3.p1  ORF type:complete len:954 (-),score=268.69 TRINITY_DN1284_c0_g1_i3:2586-5393(-)
MQGSSASLGAALTALLERSGTGAQAYGAPLRVLLGHFERSPEAASRAALHTLLAGAAAGSSARVSENRLSLLLALLRSPHRARMVAQLRAALFGANRREKFACAVLIKACAETCALLMSQLVPECNEDEDGTENESRGGIPVVALALAELLPSLVHVVRDDSAKRDGEVLPTRLTVAAADAFFAVACAQAEAPAVREELAAVLGELAAWNCKSRPLLSAALRSATHALSRASSPPQVAELLRFVSPFLIEDNPQFTRQKASARIAEALSLLEEQHSAKWPEVMALCMTLGRFAGPTFEALARSAQARLLPFVFDSLKASADELTQELLVQLVQEVVPACGGEEAAASAAVQLRELLGARDVAARAATLVLAKFAARYPRTLLGELFGLLDSQESARRANALDTLDAVLAQLPYADAGLERQLLPRLAARLSDAELSVRVQAAALFARAEPALVLPLLVPLVAHADPRTRSAAAEGVVAVMSQPGRLQRSLPALIDALHAAPPMGGSDPELARSPADIAMRGPDSAPANSAATAERAAALASKWAPRVGAREWEAASPVLASKVFGSPGDAQLIRLTKEVAPFMGPQAQELLAEACIERMRTQPHLTTSLVDGDADGSSVRALLFERLTPMLLLRVLCSGCGTVTEPTWVSSELVDLLAQRMGPELEYDEVRRIAAECTAQLFAPETTVPWLCTDFAAVVHSRLLPALHEHMADAAELAACHAKALLYAVCTAVTVHSAAASIAAGSTLVPAALGLVTGEDLPRRQQCFAKLRRGCEDCLALLCMHDAALLERVHGVSSVLAAYARTAPPAALACFADSVVLPLLNHNTEDEAVLLQALLTAAFRTESVPPERVALLVDVGLKHMQSPAAGVRLAAVKLLGVALSKAAGVELGAAAVAEQLVTAQRVLQAMANVEESEEVRAVARQICDSAFGGTT